MQKATESKATVSQPQTSAAQRQSALRKSAVGFSSPHDNLAQLAQMIHQSPRMQAERSLMADIHNSPRMVAQRRQLEGMFGWPMQHKGIDKEEPLQAIADKEESEELDTVQRQAAEEEDLAQRKSSGAAAPVQLVDEIAPKANNTGLPDHLKAGIENLSGIDMDDVKVHYNSSKPAQLQALAYAQGTDIHVAPGQEQHVPHEAWHVAQQKQGRVKPTMQMKGVAINDDQGLEREADVMGRKAASTAIGEVLNGKEGPHFLASDARTKCRPIQKKRAISSFVRLNSQIHNEGANAPVQRTIDDDIEAVRQQYNITQDEELKKILQEVLTTYEATGAENVTWGLSHQQSHMTATGEHADRQYEVVIDQNSYPDDTKRQAILTHELTHVSSDKKYNFNKVEEAKGEAAYNLLHLGDLADHSATATQFQKQRDLLSELVEQLLETVKKDRVTLGDELADYLIERLKRAEGAPVQEFDTVLTELFYYLSKAAPEHSATATFKGIREAASFAYLARNQQVPMARSYASKNIAAWKTRGVLLGAGAGLFLGGMVGSALGSVAGGVLGGIAGGFLGKRRGAKEYEQYQLS